MSKAPELVHELRTPLAAIRSNHDILEKAFQSLRVNLGANPGDETLKLLAIVEESLRINRLACERLEALIRSVRDERRKTNVHDTIENALTLLGHELKGRIRIVKDFGEITPVEARPDQLHQVFMNIILNSAQAIQGTGEIRIATRQDGPMVRIIISDSGPGIPAEIRDRIFEQGFTTKSAQSGMGLGLCICHKIIEDHAGYIEVDSEIGKGATFTIILPAAPGSERNADE
jgi:two-component system NtrC family sensor kinase